ncbi:Hypothetical protein A7982_05661 [Minicystis rosea]|nr:Hypothetical protein A7982_05661 [Minicystis rosea]
MPKSAFYPRSGCSLAHTRRSSALVLRVAYPTASAAHNACERLRIRATVKGSMEEIAAGADSKRGYKTRRRPTPLGAGAVSLMRALALRSSHHQFG